MRAAIAVCFALAVAACGFSTNSAASDGGITPGHDSTIGEGSDAAHHDAAPMGTCYGTGLVMPCLTTPPTNTISINTASTTAFSSDDPSCVMLQQANNGPPLCMVVAQSIDIKSNVRVTGQYGLVVLATTTLKISGSIDASSHADPGPGADPTSCGAGTAGGNNGTGAGGGAGGTFGGLGGAGAAGVNGNGGAAGTPAPLGNAPTFLRGGCAGTTGGNGDGGAAGLGGGALYLIAGTSIDVTSSGIIDVSGAAGLGGSKKAGGGGGGAGGMLGLDAPSITIDNQATIYADGGGGGEGGGMDDGGNDGDDPTDPTRGAAGGNGNPNGGNGGDGAYGTNPTGAHGGTNDNGGGGGGGGIGVIRMFPPHAQGNGVSPPPS